MKKRGFEVAKGFEEMGVCLPERQTNGAAGYDFQCIEDVVIPSIWSHVFARTRIVIKGVVSKINFRSDGGALQIDTTDEKSGIKPTLVKTGVKAYMGEDEYLQLCNRSSNPMKMFLLMSNGVGVIDSDYYSNESNDGHIMFQFINFGIRDKIIKKGDRIGQGIFLPFLKADNELASNKPIKQRTGGFGSTGKGI